MTREALMRSTGSIQQAAYLRPAVMAEGRAGGMKVYDVKNGKLQFLVMADKCLDIAELSYAGENVSFLSKPGLCGRNHYDTNGMEAQRSIMGGMLFTCGLRNICAPCEAEGEEHPMHGRIRTTPAEHHSARAFWQEDRYVMELSGEMREAQLFGENLVLNRRIRTVYPEPKLIIEDEIRNESFREEPFLMLYHFNIGWPMLGKDCEILIPTQEVTPRDETAKAGADTWNRMESPVDNQPEYVFLHHLKTDSAGNTFAAVYNKNLGFGLKLAFNTKELPWFMQWKSLASGDYVLGLEPANASVYGKTYHLAKGGHPTLKPQQTVTHHLELSILTPGDVKELYQRL